MRFLFSVLIVLAGVSFQSPAYAAESRALKLYESGKYAEAIAAGEAQNNGEGLAVAARAALADSSLHIPPCLECVTRVETLARRAIAADPKRTESYIYLASALGYHTRIIGIIHARLAGIPGEAKDAIDKALRLAPDDAWSQAALGGWNIEVVHLAGALVGGFIYDAHVDVGAQHFLRAIALDPGNLLLPYELALSLAAYDFDGTKDHVTELLNSVVMAQPDIAYQKTIQMRAKELLDLLAKNDRAGFVASVARFQGYP